MTKTSFYTVLIFLCCFVAFPALSEDKVQVKKNAPEGCIRDEPGSSFGGIGLGPHPTEDGIVVETILDGFPADRAGIKSNDLILEIDGKSAKGLSPAGAIKLIRGEPGSKLTLTVSRKGTSELLRFELIREKLHVARTDALGYWCDLGSAFPPPADDYFKNLPKCSPWPGNGEIPQPFYRNLKNISLHIDIPKNEEAAVIDLKMLEEIFSGAIRKNMMPFVQPGSDCKIPDLHVVEQFRDSIGRDLPDRHGATTRVRFTNDVFLVNNVREHLAQPATAEDDTLSVVVTVSYVHDTSPEAAVLHVGQFRWKKECKCLIPRFPQTLSVPLNLPKWQIARIVKDFANRLEIRGSHFSPRMMRYRCDADTGAIAFETFDLPLRNLEYNGVHFEYPNINPMQQIGQDYYYLVEKMPPLECKVPGRTVKANYDGTVLSVAEDDGSKTHKLKMEHYWHRQLRSFEMGKWEVCDSVASEKPENLMCAPVNFSTDDESIDPQLLLIRSGAEKGNPRSQESLAVLLQNAKGQDNSEAAEWEHRAFQTYLKMAEEGNIDIQCMVGDSYYQGRKGVKKSTSEALRWWRKAAARGNLCAKQKIASHYVGGWLSRLSGGDGSATNLAEGIKWYRKSVDLGDRGAMWALGSMYLQGEGVPQDYKEAYYYSTLGDSVANAAKAAWHLTAGDIAAVQQRVKKWQGAHPVFGPPLPVDKKL
ncbi:MAG: PDZ domain-containing protein [Alphaproteobacteria bacterium]|nr:MAG: PDZ domain-containing protein [Alphaproteobacteria bacterium]